MEHPEFINYLIQQYGYQKYLEIGVSTGDCIAKIKCNLIHGVDPWPFAKCQFRIPSDEFFEMLNPTYKYDIIFIDGLHTEEQVDKDVENALKHLSPNGTIMLHDCNPPTEWHQRPYSECYSSPGPWNGTCWRSVVKLKARSDIQVKTIDTDWGCTVIRRGPQTPTIVKDNFTYQDLEANREYMLGLITPQQFLNEHRAYQ